MTTESTAINYKIGNERLIRITESAAHKLESLLREKAKPDGALRLAVIGGGCSGLQYVMDLVDGPKERDILVPTQNVHLVIDPKSALFVSGSVLDYRSEEHTSELQSRRDLVCRLLLEKKKKKYTNLKMIDDNT